MVFYLFYVFFFYCIDKQNIVDIVVAGKYIIFIVFYGFFLEVKNGKISILRFFVDYIQCIYFWVMCKNFNVLCGYWQLAGIDE